MNPSDAENSAPPDFVALLLGAGQGTRLGLGTPKAHLEIRGRSLLEWCALRLARLRGHRGTVVTLDAPSLETRWPGLAQGLLPAARPCAGGATRQESCRLAYETASAWLGDFTLVLVHDAARPFFDLEACERALALAAAKGGALVGHMAVDTLKRLGPGGEVLGTIDRSEVFQAATPQIFRRELFERMLAHAAAHEVTGTDEAGLAEACGVPVHAVCAPATNLKITRPEDLLLLRGLEALLGDGPANES